MSGRDGGLLSGPPVHSAHPGRDVLQPLGFFRSPLFPRGRAKAAEQLAVPGHGIGRMGAGGSYHPKTGEEKEDRTN